MAAAREPQRLPLAIVDLAGLGALVVGCFFLRGTSIGTDPIGALMAALNQLPTTLLPTLAIASITAVNIIGGAVVFRVISGVPFPGLAHAAIGGLAAAVLLDLALLGVVASFGLFIWPVVAAFLLMPILLVSAARPFIASESWPPRFAAPTRVLGWVLVALVWCVPVLLVLASPVVPFFDVLPNHVAPVEHLRTFGGLSSLAVVPSPIFGPSRSLLGYEGVLGTLSTATGVPAAAAAAAFAGPMVALLAAAVWVLGSAIGGNRAGIWSLLFFPLTLSFLHVTDARASVLALVPTCFAVWLVVSPFGLTSGRRTVLLAAALAAAMYVHPLQGLLATCAVALAGPVLRMPRDAHGLYASAVAVIAVMPQLLTTAGIALPPWTIPLFLAAIALPLVPLPPPTWISSTVRGIRPTPGLSAAALVVVGLLAVAITPGGLTSTAGAALAALSTSPVLLAGSFHSLTVARRQPGYAMLWLAPAGALLVALLAAAVPANLAPVADVVRFEVPKSTNYFTWPLLAVAAGVGFDALAQRIDWPRTLRIVVLSAFVVGAAAPLRPGVVDPLALGEHRLSESVSISLRTAESGYWLGFPDPRFLVNDSQRQVVSAIRAEVGGGRLHATTEVVHVAASFQPWRSIPLAVFTGVIETSASLDAEASVHTVGGRLHSLNELPSLLSKRPGYVVVEPAGIDAADVTSLLNDAGYTETFSNVTAEIWRLP